MTLPDLDPFDLYDAEAARLDRFFDSLDDDGWLRPSRCAGWNVRDVLAHLAGQEAYNHACLDGTAPDLFATLAQEGAPTDLAGFNEWTVQQRRDLPVATVLAEWREANRTTRQRMRALGTDAVLETMAGPYPVGKQTLHYASELATHADDIGVPVDPTEEPDRTAWRVQVGRMALVEHDAPVVVTPAPVGLEVRGENALAQLTAPEFVAATVARLPDEHPLDNRLRETLACLA